MSEPEVEWVGTSCGKHGSYTFYKGFKLTADGQTKKYLLGEFYFVRNSKDRPICIAELQLVWHDANTGNQLASARLYFRPEATPGGRQNNHGKDELLYTDEKVVMKCRDMMNLECDGTEWSYGMKAISELNLQEVQSPGTDGKEVAKKYRLCKNILKQNDVGNMAEKERAKVVILSFPAYCRYKSLMKKLSNGLVLSKMAIIAFGGIIKNNDCTWISFSRESFHHPELDKLDMFCENKAPVLKGRPRKKKIPKVLPTKGQGRGRGLRRSDSAALDNAVGRRPSAESDSSDGNQTDTSDGSSSEVQELPCPPKLVSAVKEENNISTEVNQGVIRSVKHSSVVDAKPTSIPPVPKLVKIEPKEAEASNYERFQSPTVKVEAMAQSPHVPICRMENIVAQKLTPSSAKTSVISSTHATDGKPRKSLYQAINVPPHRNAGPSREEQTRSSTSLPVAASLPNQSTTSAPVSSLKSTQVSHAGTITADRSVQPRMSAIVSTSQEQVPSRNVEGTQNKPGSERHWECPNELKLNFKRKRGRPSGKSTKFLKTEEVKSEDRVVNKTTPLRQLEMSVVAAPDVKSEQLTSSFESNLLVGEHIDEESGDASEREFMVTLKNFMKKRGTPIEKIPALGFRKINLFKMYEVTHSLGGYDVVTAKRLWRRVYNEVGGVPSITSAATNSRKHYERLLLPYERHMKGEDSSVVIEKPDTPPSKQETENIVTTQRDQNANVVPTKEPVSIPQSQENKSIQPSKPLQPNKLPQTSKPKPQPVVSDPDCVIYSSDDVKPSVEFITSGSRGSPVMLCSSSSSSIDQRTRRHQETTETKPVMRYESRPRVITSVGRERLRNDLKPSTPDIAHGEKRPYITEIIDDEPVYMTPKIRKNEPRTSVADHERKHEYASRFATVDRVTEARPHAQESRRANDCHAQMRVSNSTPEITHESREVYKNKVPRDLGDGVLMGVRSHNHSPRPRDDPFFATFSVPVLPQSHYPHGVELYDLPNGGFPLRTSSRIFMPSSQQFFPTSTHHATTIPYPPHIIAAIGPEPGAIYQVPMPGFFPPDLPYPIEGISILRS